MGTLVGWAEQSETHRQTSTKMMGFALLNPSYETNGLQDMCRKGKQRQREYAAAVLNESRDHFMGHLSWKLS
jgi:hypothetical protein